MEGGMEHHTKILQECFSASFLLPLWNICLKLIQLYFQASEKENNFIF